ncbi:MAG TPA: 3-methyl-2-oxobutanoate hydroxymethyltransferase, partial [Polyangia bacterium]|nr:3-methyl-2-oxobutanoate hydroxymethyltransferase [Polyangia bacterium]
MSATAKPDARITAATLRARKGTDEKTVFLTAYDVVFARLADEAGIDAVLVGDSMGMVVQGERSTLGVTVDDVVYHSRIVSRGIERA